jgi:hypothetical protein
MRRLALALALAAMAGPALAQTGDSDQFDLTCYLIGKGGAVDRANVEQSFSIDLKTDRFCRLAITGDCKVMPLVKRGRWLDLSYRFKAQDQDWETYRLYDRESRSMDQVLRKVGDPGNPYGDLACDVGPFSGFRPGTP